MKTDRDTLVILIPGFPVSEADSTCLPAQQIFLLKVKELFPQLHIIVVSFQYPYHTNKYTWYGIPVIPFSGKNKGGLSRLWRQNKIYTTLKEIHRTTNIIGLISFWCGECALVGKQFSDRYHYKHYCWIMGQDAKIENNFPHKIKPAPAELIALSDFLQDEFEKNHGIRPLYVIAPGIDTNYFVPLNTVRDIDILAAGSLIPLKQYDVFIKIVAELQKFIPSIKAVLIGSGPEKEKLKLLINTCGLQSTITIAGELSHTEVLHYMQKAKLFLHTSAYEGFGVVAIEALHAGANVISFIKPMYKEIPKWYHAGSQDDMIQKSLEILKSPGSFQRVTPYSMDDTVRKIMHLFIP